MDFQPYIKYILYAMSIAGFLWVNKIFITDPVLRKWLLQSFESDNGRASGKSLSAFACTSALILGWFISIHYSKDHIAPEYYFWGILSLVGGLYGIKEVGKAMTKNGSNGNGNGNAHGSEPSPAPQKSDDKDLKKKWEESGSELTFEDWVKTQPK